METIADRELALFTAQRFSTGFDYSGAQPGDRVLHHGSGSAILCSYLLGLDVVSIAVANGRLDRRLRPPLVLRSVIADSEALFVYDNFRTGKFSPDTVFRSGRGETDVSSSPRAPDVRTRR